VHITGLGRHLAQTVLERGWNAVVTARNPATAQDIAKRYPNSALALALDVADRTQLTEAVRQAAARFGAVDVLVNNAGHGYRAAVEEADEADVDELIPSFVSLGHVSSPLCGLWRILHTQWRVLHSVMSGEHLK
jgi:NAD(P)-dependent dehydrogenase (short-subunit alcohol dehydrogenase family)